MPETTSGPGAAALSDLIPHAGPMHLLTRVLDHDRESTICSVDPASHELFHDAAGRVPTVVGIEYMAQCIAAHAGLEASDDSAPPRIGVLLGSRRVVLHRATFPNEGRLEVHARHVRGRPGLGAMSFACEVRVRNASGETTPIVEGTLSVALAEPDSADGGAR